MKYEEATQNAFIKWACDPFYADDVWKFIKKIIQEPGEKDEVLQRIRTDERFQKALKKWVSEPINGMMWQTFTLDEVNYDRKGVVIKNISRLSKVINNGGKIDDTTKVRIIKREDKTMSATIMTEGEADVTVKIPSTCRISAKTLTRSNHKTYAYTHTDFFDVTLPWKQILDDLQEQMGEIDEVVLHFIDKHPLIVHLTAYEKEHHFDIVETEYMAC